MGGRERGREAHLLLHLAKVLGGSEVGVALEPRAHQLALVRFRVEVSGPRVQD